MAFFDKLGETISSKSKDVAKKAKEIAEIASLSGKIGTQEEIIRKIYLDIGQKYYEEHKTDTSNEFGVECETITAAFDEIAKINSEIQRIKNTKDCTKCGEEVALEAIYCPKCGAQFEIINQEMNEALEVISYCPNCNEQLEGDAKTCAKCGYEIKKIVFKK